MMKILMMDGWMDGDVLMKLLCVRVDLLLKEE